MKPEQWRRIQEILRHALELLPDARTAFVEEACGNDKTLHDEVVHMLNLDEEEMAFLEHSVRLLPAGKPKNLADRKSIGPYQIVRELGRGGMGTVYLAEHEFQKKVAVKVLNRAMNTEHFVRRFHQERQILANLKHPNIAMLYDGGTTEDDLPYFVIEYVEGEPLHHYCDSRKLAIPKRLELFRKICEAVSFAHRNLVVHRDLKPGNILVTPEGEPKLLDFGIAKILSSGEETGALTMTVHRMMTPEYASPEQVEGQAITTASDVYALGILLYELLSGHSPHRFSGRSEGEVRRVVCKQQPRKPSTAIGEDEKTKGDGKTVAVTGRTVSRNRATDPQKLRRILSGDLDNIVLLALRKEPNRRYSSVEQLSEDIADYLGGYPVRARRGHIAYSAVKFVRRHGWGIAGATLVLSLILAFTLTLFLQKRQIERERNKAREVSEFLVDIFEVADPQKDGNQNVTARALLDNASLKIDRGLRLEPEVRGALMNTIGRAYANLQLFDRALPMLREALELRREIHGEDHADEIESLFFLGLTHVRRGDFANAEKFLGQAMNKSRAQLDADDPLCLGILCEFALLYHYQGNQAASISLFREVIETLEPSSGVAEDLLAQSYNGLALAYFQQGKYPAAEKYQMLAIKTYQWEFGENHPSYATAVSNLGVYYRRQAKFKETVPLFELALEIRKKVFDPDSLPLAANYNNLALLYLKLGQYDRAEPLFRQALEIRRRLLDPKGDAVASSLNNLGWNSEKQGRYHQAESLYQQALSIRQEILDPCSTMTAGTLNNLGRLYTIMGEYERAESYLQRALDIRESTLGPAAPNTGRVLENLATLRTRQGAYAEAEELYLSVLGIIERTLGAEHPEYGYNLHKLAGLYLLQNNYSEAEHLFTEAFLIREAFFDLDHPEILQNLLDLATLYGDLQHEPAALALCNQILSGESRQQAVRPLISATRKLYQKLLKQERQRTDALAPRAGLPAR